VEESTQLGSKDEIALSHLGLVIDLWSSLVQCNGPKN